MHALDKRTKRVSSWDLFKSNSIKQQRIIVILGKVTSSNSIVQISEWKQVNVLYFRQIDDFAQF